MLSGRQGTGKFSLSSLPPSLPPSSPPYLSISPSLPLQSLHSLQFTNFYMHFFFFFFFLFLLLYPDNSDIDRVLAVHGPHASCHTFGLGRRSALPQPRRSVNFAQEVRVQRRIPSATSTSRSLRAHRKSSQLRT